MAGPSLAIQRLKLGISIAEGMGSTLGELRSCMQTTLPPNTPWSTKKTLSRVGPFFNGLTKVLIHLFVW